MANISNPLVINAINNLMLGCLKFSRPDHEINLKLYTEKKEIRVYVYLEGWEKAWKDIQNKCFDHYISLNCSDQDLVNQIHKVYIAIEKSSKNKNSKESFHAKS
ncbi:hypothetical protein GWP85_11120 [Acinetobacter beijerinckii]|uniref:hypothetical protein n=1 Tax=Acinetobacter beijerinckii TaxID=262668 RepID=UPI0023DDB613|nr:hypothetical protein [Acinetobacter beijerinckii]MDF2418053.1 hypothetical protein [Acinetobacter beijerinckii]